jgi:hypothetical protein
MEILNSGSFINLENQEKIEQLKYTAIELANAASSTTGFTNEEEPAKKLALEFWQGLEYMCRESERGAIQNIFTGEFLESLRELRPAAIISEIAPTDETPEIVPELTSQTIMAEDEFLGVLAPESQEFAAIENKDEIQKTPVSEEVLTSTEIDLTETGKNESVEFAENESDPAQSEEIVSLIAKKESLSDGVETEAGLSLPEKEPYQFNKCTVTATIQLLPEIENSETRKAVLSVRTHDFSPNITLVEVSANNLMSALAPEIEKVLAQYKSDLPFKVMDKMKKEKAAPKRNTPKVSTETKSVSQVVAKPKEAPITPNTPTTTAQEPQRAETGMQGSLFGF